MEAVPDRQGRLARSVGGRKRSGSGVGTKNTFPPNSEGVDGDTKFLDVRGKGSYFLWKQQGEWLGIKGERTKDL